VSAVIDNPIINRPYGAPTLHWRFDDNGVITDETIPGRRPSEYWSPVPKARKTKGRAVQSELDLNVTGERRRVNDEINRIRARVDRWRALNYPNVTPTTRRLLEYWTDPERDNKVLFCQREAVETAIYLAEAAQREGDGWIRNLLVELNAEHNDGLPRVAFKMATGSGKTVVMAMLIAWQTLNKVAAPQDARFTRRFLLVTPGVTIRDRLRVLIPSDQGNYYRLRDLVPSDLWTSLLRAEIVITNFHSFLYKATKEGKAVSANTKLYLRGDRSDGDIAGVFTETPEQMVNRVLREFSGGRSSEIIVINDEAHHCYRGRTAPVDDTATTEQELTGDEKNEAKARNVEAKRWFTGLRDVQRKTGIKTVYDLSATPFFLKGSGYPEGYLFPWVASDFSLMDAIEAGIVKIPRVPVDDNTAAADPAYRALWSKVATLLPKKSAKTPVSGASQGLPGVLEGALHSLYGHYEKAYHRWEQEGLSGETPPVFIVVCNNTAVSKLVFDYVAGYTVADGKGETVTPGRLGLFSNVTNGQWVASPRTILVDSVQLESGESLNKEFREAAASEIEKFKQEFRKRTNHDPDDLDDGDLLREVMNTVGKPGSLGSGVRCVVSVSMLTEGWDAKTVTHILGVRAFGSQLLCEQVVGRGLRRRSYDVNQQGFFSPEYAEVYGVPFSFIRTEADPKDAPPRRTPVHVQAVEDRAHLRIRFPRLDGYRQEESDSEPYHEFGAEHQMRLKPDIATWTQTSGVIGEQAEHHLDDLRAARPARVAFELARRLVHDHYTDDAGGVRSWLFPHFARIAREWIDECVTLEKDAFLGQLLLAEAGQHAAQLLQLAIYWETGGRPPRISAIMRASDPEGSTDSVNFFTSRQVVATTKSPVNYVVLDGTQHGDGNTWERDVAEKLELLPQVVAYVKNDHLEFDIPYLHGVETRRYRPDFLARIAPRESDAERTLIVEVSGAFKSADTAGAAKTSSKALTARERWCAAVNNHGGFGRWGYVEIKDPATAEADLRTAIDLLYADAPITGLPT
jgi:type III restriction enzyme